MEKIKARHNAYSIYRIAKTKDLREIGFGEKAYYETRAFYLNAKKHGKKTGVVSRKIAVCNHFREVNKGYKRGFDTYRTYHEKNQDRLYGKKEIRQERLHIADLNLSGLQLSKPHKFDKNIEPVDIIIITYERKYYLFQTIDQIIRDTKYPYRLIVVDNGSTDGTREWIKEQHKNGLIWKYIFSKENTVMNVAFKKGLKEVESKLFITNADDIPPPSKLEPCWLTYLVNLFNENYPEFFAIGFDFSNISFLKYLTRKYGKARYKKEFLNIK